MSQALDLSSYRRYFPSLAQVVDGKQAVYLDNPGGTQVAQQVIDAMISNFHESNANTHGAFLTSKRTDRDIAAPRSPMAHFLHPPSPYDIIFIPTTTTF